jgi:glycosyltransferase involved in cell wall biosynthesis
MHVLLLGPYPPPQGGVQRNLLAIRDELLAAGHECSIVNITRRRAGKGKNAPEESNVYHPQTPLALLRLLFKLKYDLLHIHIGGEIPLRVLGLLAVCALIAAGKSVLTLHSGGYPLSRAGRAARRFSLRGMVFRRFAKIICVNRQQVEMFEKYGASRENVRLISPFFNRSPNPAVTVPERLQKFAAAHSPFLLTVGLLQPLYRLPLQIEALGRLREKFPDAGLMIVGAGESENELRRLIASKSYGEHILLAGDVEHAVTLHLINDCDALLRTTAYDGDAISVREALHLNTPVVATDNGMRPEGVFLISLDGGKEAENALAKAVEDVLRNEKIVREKRPDDCANIIAVINLYREIVGAPKAAAVTNAAATALAIASAAADKIGL